MLALVPSFAAAQWDDRPWPRRYGGRDTEARPLGLEGRALGALRQALREAEAPECRPSRQLGVAARAHARALLEEGGPPRRVDPRLVREEVLRAGAVDPAVVPWAVSWSGDLDPSARLARFAARLSGRPLTHCAAGAAASGNRHVLVVLGVRRRFRLDHFPSRVAPGDRVRLTGWLEAGYRTPSVMVTTPRGEIVARTALRRAGRFGASLDFPATGRYTVEVMAVGRRGPEAVALFPVFVGAEPEELPTPGPAVSAAPAATGREPAQAVLLRLLNEERRRADLPALETDRELGRLATEHSADMLEQGYFGHVSPSGRDVTERLRLGGFIVLRAAENLARSASPTRAHRTLMDSPAHRANILDPALTHVGIGVARREGELVVTQIFVSW